MLNELCRELRNWFDRDQPHLHGAFEIKNGTIADKDFTDVIQTNQYFAIQGSVFNDGVYKYTNSLELTDELFVGSVVLMAVPREVLDLSNDIDNWLVKYGGVDSEAMSPFASESFGGYAYSKSANSSSGGSTATWQSVFASRLNKWRKV